MTLGFIGAGAITSAVVNGLSSDGRTQPAIVLSPRNAEVSADLARRFAQVSVAPSNQDVVDGCEIVVVAVRPQVVRNVLSQLRFRAHHHVISVVAGISLATISELVAPAGKVTRAIPLPSAANRRSPTAIYPRDQETCDLFAAVGTTFAVDTETEFDALSTAGATVSSFLAFAESIASWVARQGVPQAMARDYVARIFSGLSDEAVAAPERSFQSLGEDHATVGGINEQLLNHLRHGAIFETLSQGLDAVMKRIRQ
jgi:pyrroline-5-carboxylate reductase